MQRWKKLGRIYGPVGDHQLGHSHAQVPTPYLTADGSLRVYFGARDSENRTHTFSLEINGQDPTRIDGLPGTPLLPLGALGCFDDRGVMPSCVVPHGGQTWLYYTGWNTSTSVPYRNSIGLAISEDGGRTFVRPFKGPVLERSATEPHFCATPFVMREGSTWRMWYLSCSEWLMVDGKPEARYLIRHTESSDGIEWHRPGTVAIDYQHSEEAIARPWIVKDGSEYRMWYCYRSIRDYRRNANNGYRVGYAVSTDGLSWQRHDQVVDLHASADGWDTEMTAYPAVFDVRQRRYLLYNGNGFGAIGFGLAELI